MNTHFPHLLSPGQIGNMQLKNHVIMGPTETLYASSDGEITRPIIDYYVRRAKGVQASLSCIPPKAIPKSTLSTLCRLYSH